ncbi:hypothetical protein HMPREF3098_10465 [Corynebacterium sp. HMSC28B08]|nr:hypothetical protein HMPREF3098_10465 [Corynebacterium sp. HMSC28B08]
MTESGDSLTENEDEGCEGRRLERGGSLRKRQKTLECGGRGAEIISMLYDVLMVAVTCALFGAMGAAVKAVDKL